MNPQSVLTLHGHNLSQESSSGCRFTCKYNEILNKIDMQYESTLALSSVNVLGSELGGESGCCLNASVYDLERQVRNQCNLNPKLNSLINCIKTALSLHARPDRWKIVLNELLSYKLYLLQRHL